MGRIQCTLKVARHARVWKFLSLFLPLLALGHSGHSYAEVKSVVPATTYPGNSYPDVFFYTVPVSGSYDGTTVITPMTQTGEEIFVVNENKYTLQGTNPFALRANFTSPVSFVSVSFGLRNTATGILQVYSAEGTLLGDQVHRDSAPFVLSFNSSSTPFAYFLATYIDGYERIGEVRYEVAAVPEPETYAMMLAGLGLVGAAVRRRRG